MALSTGERSPDDELASNSGPSGAPNPLPVRAFRPDVEGLRAVAILLVVAYHAGVPGITGGYVGVDVFFVISGFVITGVLARERAGTGRTSLANFYARRARRIVPAASVVTVLTTVAAYHWLGFVAGNQVALDGRWAAGFLANLHFAAIGTNYLASQAPPSPLQSFWSLAVEEQFYLVYPLLFLVVVGARGRLSRERRLGVLLGVVVAVSFTWSIHATGTNAISAYFSPFTRAWELALGAGVALGAPVLQRLPRHVAAAIAWAGLCAIVVSAVSFGAQTVYPGAWAAVPVVGAALVIAGGCNTRSLGPEFLLATTPFAVLGRLSYSLYLWHWPVLVIAAQYYGRAQFWPANLGWLALALGLSIVSYLAIEGPIRGSRALARRRAVSIAVGVALAAATFGILSLELALHP